MSMYRRCGWRAASGGLLRTPMLQDGKTRACMQCTAYTHTDGHVYVRACVHTDTYTYTYTHIHIHVPIHIHIYIHLKICVHTCTYIAML